ncbi:MULTISPECIES: 3-hydroxyacyl-CoA dehydrogenase NAD-binding domain-containing protein [unclassified Pseudomonas]|uniref:3-hydroxyacyl-CoA dehydrogenase NAD-binding domain-containing protein n=1 Tax=unclassified Pseudomonas TaxID=196821 RepID=UPI00131EA9ED|nr:MULTISPECIES: 3-hydroxyacyl-CoA dehydrogenase NAD-binding domain-containing protein [unclassified Pseudomonas]
MTTVTLRRIDALGVITLDHPPVNALSRKVRAGLLARLQEALADDGIQTLVITCAGRTFVAGADLREFDLPLQEPHLPDVLAALEASPKPVIAALHGTVLGGGLELALACHYRVAATATTFALPEVSLGLIPGAGGTQRLPRLVGGLLALDMIVGGTRLDASAALAAGLIDGLGEGEPLELVQAFWLEHPGLDRRPTAARKLAPFDLEAFEAQARGLLRKLPGHEAPVLALDALRGAWQLSLSAALQRERELFVARRESAQARALRQVFFAERALAGRNRALAKAAPPVALRQVAVIGAGLMGSGIALCLANAGLATVLIDTQPQALERGRATIDSYFSGKGRLTADQASARAALIRCEATLDAVADADLIIEAVFEDLAVKQEVFRQLDCLARPGAILATNTSYLDIDAIAGVTGRPEAVIGMHFFSPAQVMKLLEVVRTRAVAPAVLATALQLGERLGKTTVAVGNCHGFVGNRLLAVREREATLLVEEGAAPEQVDRVLREFGFPMGPFELRDLAGIDIAWRNRQGRGESLSPAERACDLIEQLHARGRLGQKSGAGYYRYEPGQRQGQADPLIAGLLAAHRQRRGIAPRSHSDTEILERCLFVMINEAAWLLEEGIVEQPVDIDLVWLHGYGFPRYRGGLLYHADQCGLERIVSTLEGWSAALAERGTRISPRLRQLAAEGRTFLDL